MSQGKNGNSTHDRSERVSASRISFPGTATLEMLRARGISGLRNRTRSSRVFHPQCAEITTSACGELEFYGYFNTVDDPILLAVYLRSIHRGWDNSISEDDARSSVDSWVYSPGCTLNEPM